MPPSLIEGISHNIRGTLRATFIETSPAAKTEDVYVKIDRFHSARKALNGAREKLKDIEEIMKKLRETRMREEQELMQTE